jgi:aerobic-type carbon monoxide dehydrogenase small subunit (CoxS/CutS family)
MSRVTHNVERPDSLTLTIDGMTVTAFPGETVAAAMLMAQQLRFRDDRSGTPRGMFCNMGTCSECMVWLARDTGWRRVRACLIPVAADMVVTTREQGTEHG